MRRELSVFQHLFLLVFGAGLTIAAVSGVAHHYFTERLMTRTVQGEMTTALRAAVAYFEHTYTVPAFSELRLLESSPLVDAVLLSADDEELMTRPDAERLFLAVAQSRADVHKSITLLDSRGTERVVVAGNRRERDFVNVLEMQRDVSEGFMAALFRRLQQDKPGTVHTRGPFVDKQGRQVFLAGIAKYDPEIGGVGGAIIAEFYLADYLKYVRQLRVFDHALVWLFAADGTALSVPGSAATTLNPAAYLFDGAGADGGIVVSEEIAGGPADGALLRVAIALSAGDLAEHVRGAWYITLGVAGISMLLAFALAYPVAGRFSAPVRSLAQMAGRLGAGSLNVRVPEKWSGELGHLAAGFNQTAASLRENVVSRAHMDNILQSMSESLLVVDTQGSIIRTNPAMLALLGYGDTELVGRNWHQVLADADAADLIAARLAAGESINGYHTELRTSGGRTIPVALSCAVLGVNSGENEGLVLLAQDITEQRHAEQLLRSQQQILEKIATGHSLSDVLEEICARIEALTCGAMCTVMLREQDRLKLVAGPSVPADVAEVLAVVELGEGMGSCAAAAQSGGLECVIDALEDSRWSAVRSVAERFGIRSCWSVAIRSSSGEVLGTFAITGAAAATPEPEHLQLLETAAHVAGIAIEGHRVSQQLSWQARHDTLTGLFNRQEFEQRLRQAIDSARQGGLTHALCYLDLDQFKVVNDTCGHLAGDELLRQLACELSTQLRKSDTLARLGGDEFGLLISDCDLDNARRVAEAARNVIAEYLFSWEGKTFGVGVSIGLVPINACCAGIESLLTAADAACYAAKDQGRNRIHVYQEEDQELCRRRGEMQWVSRIQAALEEDRFELYYQLIEPLSDTVALPGLHFELLLRMRDERGELVPPGAFLPAAERYGLAPRLDRWVVDRALDAMQNFCTDTRALGLCSINLSGHSVADEEFARYVIDRVQRCGIAPERICFEITETAAISNLSRAVRFIQALKSQGCLLALDDFGSGLSSFGYLKNLPVDMLKIDGMFVKDIVDDPIDFAMVKSINELGKQMGKRTIAEFVENAEIMQRLQRIGVDYAQGYGIAAPRPLKDLLQEGCGTAHRSVL